MAGATACGGTWRVLLKALTATLLVLLAVVGPVPCSALVARCPPKETSAGSGTDVSYCSCQLKEFRSGILINITCNFQKKEVRTR